jgi:membrane protein
MRQWRNAVVGTVQDLMRNHTLAFAAALSYYFVMAFFPALIALAAIIAYLPIPDLFNTIVSTLSRVMPPESMGLVRKIVSQIITPNRGALLSFGLAGTLWSASGGFASMIEALNVAYDIPETRPMWRTRLIALELTFEVGTLILIAFTVMILGPGFGQYLASHLGLSWVFAMVWPYLRYTLAVAFIVLAIEGLYFIAPNLKQRFRDTLPGAIVAVVGWILLSAGLSFYIHHFAKLNKTYGVLGGGIALLIWMYWSSFAILVGAELNSEIIQQRGDGKLTLKRPPPEKVHPHLATTAEEARPAA